MRALFHSVLFVIALSSTACVNDRSEDDSTNPPSLGSSQDESSSQSEDAAPQGDSDAGISGDAEVGEGSVEAGAGDSVGVEFVSPVDGESVERVIEVVVSVTGWEAGEPIWLVVGSPGGGDFPLRGRVLDGVARWSGVTVGAVKDDGVEFTLMVVGASSAAQVALDRVEQDGDGVADVLSFDGVVDLDQITVVRD